VEHIIISNNLKNFEKERVFSRSRRIIKIELYYFAQRDVLLTMMMMMKNIFKNYS